MHNARGMDTHNVPDEGKPCLGETEKVFCDKRLGNLRHISYFYFDSSIQLLVCI